VIIKAIIIKRRDDEPRYLKRRCDMMLDFVSAGRDRDPTTVGQKQRQQNRERR